jgi:hypothetical protein
VVLSRWFVTLLMALGAFSVALPASADEPTPTVYYDPNAYPPPSARWGLAAVGVGAFAVWYGGAVGFSYIWPDAPGAEHLRTPLVGPWLALGETGCADDDPDCSTFVVVLRAILTTIDGVAQAGGVAAVGEALFMPTVEPGPTPPPKRLRLERRPSSKLRVTPVMTQGALGLGFSGTF